MKNTIIAIAVLMLGTLAAKAQTEKGTKNLGFGLAFLYSNYGGFNNDPTGNSPSVIQSNKNTSFGITPSYGYFIADKLDLNVGLGYTYSNAINSYYVADGSYSSGPDKQTSNSYSAIVAMRKYFMYQNKIGIRTGSYASYGIGDQKNTYLNATQNYDSKTTYYSAGAMLDLLYYPIKNMGITATLVNLAYSHNKTDAGARGYQNQDNFNLGLLSNGLVLSVFYAIGN